MEGQKEHGEFTQASELPKLADATRFK